MTYEVSDDCEHHAGWRWLRVPLVFTFAQPAAYGEVMLAQCRKCGCIGVRDLSIPGRQVRWATREG